MTISTNPANESASQKRDLQLLLKTVEAAIENLIDHPEKLATLHDRSKAWFGESLADRIGSAFPLSEYVEHNWDTIRTAYSDTPIIAHLALEVAEDRLLAALGSNPREVIEHWEDCHSACTRALSRAKANDAASAEARASIESDLRNIRDEEREQRWLNGEDD